MDNKIKLRTELKKKLKNEMSTTGTGASVTPGSGEGVSTKYAFAKKDNGNKIAKDYIKTFGGELAPSIPNRPSKAFDYKELWEVGEYESLAGILKQLGAEKDSIKILIKAIEMGALKPTDAITIVKKALGKKEIKEAKLDIDNRVKVTYSNEFYSETGTITDIKRGFVTVEMDRDGKEYSMHSSDVVKIEDKDDDEDMLQEGYAQFRNKTKTRTKPEQFHTAVKEIKKKMNEINRIFEYVDRLKTELSEGEDLKYKKYTENAFQQIKESAKQLFLKSTKLK
jgi:hypothetical protein